MTQSTSTERLCLENHWYGPLIKWRTSGTSMVRPSTSLRNSMRHTSANLSKYHSWTQCWRTIVWELRIMRRLTSLNQRQLKSNSLKGTSSTWREIWIATKCKPLVESTNTLMTSGNSMLTRSKWSRLKTATCSMRQTQGEIQTLNHRKISIYKLLWRLSAEIRYLRTGTPHTSKCLCHLNFAPSMVSVGPWLIIWTENTQAITTIEEPVAWCSHTLQLRTRRMTK